MIGGETDEHWAIGRRASQGSVVDRRSVIYGCVESVTLGAVVVGSDELGSEVFGDEVFGDEPSVMFDQRRVRGFWTNEVLDDDERMQSK